MDAGKAEGARGLLDRGRDRGRLISAVLPDAERGGAGVKPPTVQGPTNDPSQERENRLEQERDDDGGRRLDQPVS